MIVKIFDDLKSYFHFLLGFLTPFLGRLGLFVVVVYLIYQYFDKDSPEEKIGDLVEYFLGMGGWELIRIIRSTF